VLKEIFMPVAVVVILLVIGSIIFHFASPWWFTPLASNWGTIDDTINITFWVTGAVFIAINLFMAYAVIRFRNKKDSKPAKYEPENKKLEIWLTVVTAIGVAAMLGPGLYVWNDFVHVPEEAWEVDVVGEQWRWSYRLPGEDGLLGTSDTRLVGPENHFGINPNDPNSQDDLLITSNVLHIPVDKPVKLLLRSKDVLHDFAVAEFRVKMDLVPGLVSYMWFTPTKVGSYEVLCEELCGLAHFTMRGRVVVDTQEDFETWQAQQMTYAESLQQRPADPMIGSALYGVCATCHGSEGEGNLALNSPKLGGQPEWYINRQLHNFKQGYRGAHKDDLFGAQMAPMAAILIDDAAISDVTAYIGTLPFTESEQSITGDIARGEDMYSTCGVCHGESGEGNYATNSPRLSGQEDWYMKRQLMNFKDGIRGAHPGDIFGPQMASMSRMLRTEDDINDIIAYINTLPNQQDNQIAAMTQGDH